MSSGVGVPASVSPSITSRPTALKKFSSPAGVTMINIRAGFRAGVLEIMQGMPGQRYPGSARWR